MKKKLFIGALVSLASIPMAVSADGISTVKFEGTSNVNVGDEFTVSMVMDNIEGTNGGIVAFGGYINFDNSVLELVSTNQADNSYEVLINRNINKIAALDYTLSNGIKERTKVYELTFKAINEGNTSITLTDGEVVDTNSEVSFTVEGLNVNSNNIVIEEEIINDDNYIIQDNEVITSEETKVNNIKNKKSIKTTKKIKTKTNKNNFLNNIINFINSILKK